jgi:hypothetical protein
MPKSTDMKRVFVDRRTVLRGGLAGLAALMGPSFATGCSSEESGGSGGAAGSSGSGGSAGQAGASGAGGSGGGPALTSNIASIGPLGDPDANGLRLPPGFSSRIVAQSGQPPIAGNAYTWHSAPDGGATFATEDGGWIYVSNSEIPLAGGVGALRFDESGTLVDAYAILTGSSVNCAGGKTPWGTWLSCEEVVKGRVFECDPRGENAAVPFDALGIFKHEAAAVDPATGQIYLSEDEGDGRFYRFTPDSVDDGRSNLSAGTLEVAEVAGDGSVTWHALSDPTFTGSTPTRQQVPQSTAFDGGEGLAVFEGVVYLGTKGDNRVWAFDIATQKMSVLYDAETAANPILTGVDNLTVSCCGDVIVSEDGGDMEIVAILPDGTLKPLLQITGHSGSEVTGPAFDPSGTRLYFSSQRGPAGGVTYEVSGPFHLPAG